MDCNSVFQVVGTKSPVSKETGMKALSIGTNPGKYRTGWFSLSSDELELIIRSVEILIDAGIEVESNYEEQLMAIIHLRQKKNFGKHDLHYALRVARRWIAKFPMNANGHFMLGVLLLMHGIQSKERNIVTEATEILNVSSCLFVTYPSKKCEEMLRFVIIKANGLRALRPYNSYSEDRINRSCMQKFQGRLHGNNIYVRPFVKLLPVSVFIDSEDCLFLADQGPLLEFNIAFSYRNPMVAINVEPVRFTGPGSLRKKQLGNACVCIMHK